MRVSITPFYGPLLLALAYFLGAQAAFFIGTLSDQIFALFWPPNVILFCALLIVPQRQWWLYIAAAFVAHVVAELGVGMPVPQLLVAFATNCLVALLNAYGVRRMLGGPPWFGTFHNASLYIVITAGIAPAIAALGGAFVPILGGGALGDYWLYWSYWYLANALPSLTIGPVFLIWLTDSAKWSRWIVSRRQIGPALSRWRSPASASSPPSSPASCSPRAFRRRWCCCSPRCRWCYGRRCATARRAPAQRS